MIKVIGIAGYARCGKDTFVGIAKNILSKNGYTPIRIAFADNLKEETEGMLRSNGFDATVYTEDTEAKKLIRPLLVWWGCQRRNESENGLYWVDSAHKKLQRYMEDVVYTDIPDDKFVFLISDVRFQNEVKWVQETWNGEVIHLKRWTTEWHKGGQDGSNYESVKVYDPAPNDEEKKNDPLVQNMVNYRIEWESAKKMTSEEAIADTNLQTVVLKTLNETKFFKLPSVTGTLLL